MSNPTDHTATLILDKAEELFYRLGYSKVTMDDLARELGMSKKTVYNHIPNKKALLQRVVERFKTDMSDRVDEILLDDDMSFNEKLHRMLSVVGQRLSEIGPWFVEDLRKNAPFIWQDLQSYKRDAAFRRFNKLLDEGIKKGQIRPDINKTMAVMLYAGAIETFINPRLMEQVPVELQNDLPYQPSAIFEGMVKIMLEGVLKTKE